MHWIQLVTLLAAAQLFWFGIQVGRARSRHEIKAPAMTGEPRFERVVRVQQNTVEVLLIFYPALWVYGLTVSPVWGAGIGAIYLIGRFVYAAGYTEEAGKRGLGFMLSIVPTIVLLVGGLIGIGKRMIGA